MNDWRGRKIAVIGAARQGIALARYLAAHGARVVVNDRRPAVELQAVSDSLPGEQVEWVLGGHPLSLLDGVDLVCVSGGVPLENPLVQEAVHRGIPLSNDSQIFLEAAPCQVIGITGSAGKTTVTTLVGRMASAAFESLRPSRPDVAGGRSSRRVWVGGNIGLPLITAVDEMNPGDLAVMELSSFQLELMTRSPKLAAVLNVTPNHLDRHGTMEAYTAAKARILEFQDQNDVAVLNREDPGSWALLARVQGELVTFGIVEPPAGITGTYLDAGGEKIRLRCQTQGEVRDTDLLSRDEISLRGEHNLLNVLSACAIAVAAGLPPQACRAGVIGFTGVPHRLEWVRTWGGADWYNDSIATAPERAIAAIRSFDEPLVLLAGGRDKDLPWLDFARLVSRRVDHLILFGEAGQVIYNAIELLSADTGLEIIRRESLQEAVKAAAEVIKAGAVVLLSPGGTSFDEFRDFEERGEAFRKWVMELE